jgi:transcriptional regulator with XRE-family HTH domain
MQKQNIRLVTDRPHPIVRRCRELGITQNELARRLGVRPGTVSRYVTGKVRLTGSDIRTINLMEVLGINLNYLKRY